MSDEYVNFQSAGWQKRQGKREFYASNMMMQTSNMENVTKSIQQQKVVELTTDQKEMISKLFQLVKDGEENLIVALLKDGVLPNDCNEAGDYPLHVAMERKDALEIAQAFLDGNYKYSVNINVQNKKKETPLHLAIKSRNNPLILYLLKKGAIPNFQDENGNTALHLIAMDEKGIEKKTLEMCLDYGANIDLSNNQGKLCSQLTDDTEFQRLFMEFKFDRNSSVVGGDIEVGLAWKNLNDLDLHCYCRDSTHIYYGDKKCPKCRGFLDWDMNVSPTGTDPKLTSQTPVEHIYWPHITPGKFVMTIKYFRNHPGIERDSEYYVFMNVKGENIYQSKGVLKVEREEPIIFGFEVADDKTVTLLDASKLKIPEIKQNNDVQFVRNMNRPPYPQLHQERIPMQGNSNFYQTQCHQQEIPDEMLITDNISQVNPSPMTGDVIDEFLNSSQ